MAAAETSALISYSPIVISLIALAVSVKVYFENKRHTLISHEPHLAGNEINNNGEDIYTVQNKGNGVAFVTNLQYFLNDKPTDLAPKEFIKKYYKDIPFIETSITTLGGKSIFAIGEKTVISRVKYDIKYTEQLSEISKKYKYGMIITYACAYGIKKRWSTSDNLLEKYPL